MSYPLVDAVNQLGQPRVLLLGDFILDQYIWGDAERISQEAPVPLLRETNQEERLGGAANVVQMLCGLGADVVAAGVIGDDDAGRRLCKQLEACGVSCGGVIRDSDRPTTVKVRFIGRAQHRHPHQMLRVDREVRTPLSTELSDQLCQAVLPQLVECHAVLISDYAKGVCTEEVLNQVISVAREKNIPVIVDPASSVDYARYRGATAMTPNRLEASHATLLNINTPQDAFVAGQQLCERLGMDWTFITLDSDGIALTHANGKNAHLPTRKREVYDITGAGDMVLAMIGVGAAAGLEPEHLGRLANVAGGLEVEQIGVVTISREQILADLLTHGRMPNEKVCDAETLRHHVNARRKIGQKVVMTNGCFDLLHTGHVAYLQQAAALGDCLVVAINSDDSVRLLEKAPDRPIFDQTLRGTMLAALEAVDYVVIFDESTPHAVLESIQPEILVKGGTYSKDEVVGKEYVESYGGEVEVLGLTPGMSTTSILHRIRNGQRVTSDEPIQITRKAG